MTSTLLWRVRQAFDRQLPCDHALDECAVLMRCELAHPNEPVYAPNLRHRCTPDCKRRGHLWQDLVYPSVYVCVPNRVIHECATRCDRRVHQDDGSIVCELTAQVHTEGIAYRWQDKLSDVVAEYTTPKKRAAPSSSARDIAAPPTKRVRPAPSDVTLSSSESRLLSRTGYYAAKFMNDDLADARMRDHRVRVSVLRAEVERICKTKIDQQVSWQREHARRWKRAIRVLQTTANAAEAWLSYADNSPPKPPSATAQEVDRCELDALATLWTSRVVSRTKKQLRFGDYALALLYAGADGIHGLNHEVILPQCASLRRLLPPIERIGDFGVNSRPFRNRRHDLTELLLVT
jgi:hypothetical protein